jgi:uncharacterized protein YbaR (Trm112 family)
MDILACPMCRNFPLTLRVFQVDKRYVVKNVFKCEVYCSYHGDNVKNLSSTNCEECYTYEITDGLLICDKCSRWYPIIDDIPIMLPDSLRDKRRESAFLEKWKDKIPENIIKHEKENYSKKW